MKRVNKLIITLLALLVLPVVSIASDTTWEQLKLSTQDQYTQGLGSGRQMQWMTGAARCEANPNVVYLAHDCGGIWRSDDGGVTWVKPLMNGLYTVFGMDVEVDPVDCNRVVGVWSNGYDYRHPDWDGIYLSTDGGNNWSFKQHTSSTYVPQGGSRFYQDTVEWAPASVDAQGAVIWYAVGQSDSSRSVSPNSDYSSSAIYYSSDRGVTWSAKANVTSILPVYDIEVSPTSSSTLLVASASGLRRSTDSGATIASYGNLPSGKVKSLEYDPNNANIVYATVTSSSANGVYKSTNGGSSFTRLSNATWNSILQSAERVFVHPSNSSIYYVVPSAGTADAIRTTNGGSTYSQTSVSLLSDVASYRWGKKLGGVWSFVLPAKNSSTNAMAQSWGAFVVYSTNGTTFIDSQHENSSVSSTNRSVVWDPSNANRFLVGCLDGGAWLTEDGGVTFTPRDDGSICSTSNQANQAISPSSPNTWLSTCSTGGFNTSMIRTTNAGVSNNWSVVDSASSYRWQVWYHPTNPNYAYSAAKRSTNAGASWSSMPGASGQVMDYCLSSPNTLYAVSGSSILRSTNAGDSWSTYVTAGWSLAPYDPMPVFAVDQNNCNTVWTVDSSGDLAKYNGSSWTSAGLLSMVSKPAGYWIAIRSVLVDPNNADVIYATLYGNGVSPLLFRSTDGGSSWSDITYNHFRQHQSGISINPNTGEVFMGGCSGLWRLDAPYSAAGPDVTPDPFSFTDITGALQSTSYTSTGYIIVSGIDPATAIPISITGNDGEFEKNESGSWFTTGTVVLGDTVKIRQTSDSQPGITVGTTLTIGGVTDTDAPWTVTTAVTGVPALITPALSETGVNRPVSFTWSAVPGAVAYNIQIDDAPDFVSPVIDTVVLTNSYSATTLLPSTRYWWRVRAR